MQGQKGFRGFLLPTQSSVTSTCERRNEKTSTPQQKSFSKGINIIELKITMKLISKLKVILSTLSFIIHFPIAFLPNNVVFGDMQPMVAIFYEPNFPYYMGNEIIQPKFIVDALKEIGIGAALLNAQQLSDTGVFNYQQFKILIHLYGNTFPVECTNSIIQFHRAGGSIISPGVPFCHPCERTDSGWKDLDHSDLYYSHDKIGTGRFYEPPRTGIEVVYFIKNDPLNFDILKYVDKNKWCQTITSDSQSDQIIPILGYQIGNNIYPIVGIIKHYCTEFRGAIDVRYGVLLNDADLLNIKLTVELLKRSVAYILQEKGLYPRSRFIKLISKRVLPNETELFGITPVSEPKPFDGVLPRAKPLAQKIYVLDVERYSTADKLLAVSIQGIVNKNEPQVFLKWTSLDPAWLSYFVQKGYISSTENINTLSELVNKFRQQIKGKIIYDPNMQVTVNIATMLAGVKDAMIVSPTQAEQYPDIPVVEDLRNRWEKDVDAYCWMFDNYWDEMNHHVLCVLWPWHLATRDYMIQNKIFIFWISGTVDGQNPWADTLQEITFAEKLLSKTPPNIPVLGYCWAGKGVGIGEIPSVALFAGFAKYLVGSSDGGNMSLLSGIPPGNYQRKKPPAPTLQRDKVYISFVVSDGDNLPVLSIAHRDTWWVDSNRGKFALGWTISPAAIDVIPSVLEYYYDTATENDDFMAAVSGIGYTYPDSYAKRYKDREKIYEEFLQQTGEYMKKLDLNTIWIMHATKIEVIDKYAKVIPELIGIFPDYGRTKTSYRELNYFVSNNVAVFHAVGQYDEYDTMEERLNKLANEIRAFTAPERPFFMHVFCLNWFLRPTHLAELKTMLGDEYVVVRPDHLCMLYRKAMGKE